jgi:hypothetical protein
MTLPTESGEETPLESLSMSSVSGLKSSRDMRRGRGRVGGVSVPLRGDETVTERRTSGNWDLEEPAVTEANKT